MNSATRSPLLLSIQYMINLWLNQEKCEIVWLGLEIGIAMKEMPKKKLFFSVLRFARPQEDSFSWNVFKMMSYQRTQHEYKLIRFHEKVHQLSFYV
jgi:hypothetical protein